MTETLNEVKGVVRGRTIELEEETGLPDGTAVTVSVRTTIPPCSEKLPPGEGLRRALGGWAGDDEEGLDEYLAWCREQRQQSRPEIDA